MMPPVLVDTHSHIHFNAFKNDAEEVWKRAHDENIWMIAVGTQSDTSKNGVAFAEAHDGVWSAVALHPNHLFETYIDEAESPFRSREEDFDSENYRTLAQHPKCVAIGECGIDYFHLPTDVPFATVHTKQTRVFRAHLDLADEVGKPVIVHCRDAAATPQNLARLDSAQSPAPSKEMNGAGSDLRGSHNPSAHDDVIRILTEYVNAGKLLHRGVIHCYSSDWAHAEKYLALGFFISFTGTITFPPKKSDPRSQEALLEVVRRMPIDRILVETDAPYLSPVPRRGARNEPQYVRHVAEKIAEVKNLPFDEVAKQTTQNAIKLFCLQQ